MAFVPFHTTRWLAALVACSFVGSAHGWVPDTPITAATVSFRGEHEGDRAGTAVAGVGDVNGDGYDDFAVGTPFSTQTLDGVVSGRVYLLFGGNTPWSGLASLSEADVILDGETEEDKFGHCVDGGGDVNGDGYDDILVGAPHYDGPPVTWDTGAAYLVLGRSGGWPQHFDMSLADASFMGADPGEWTGGAVSVAPDLDGDGLDDLIIAGPASPEAAFDAGQVHIVFGRASGWALQTALSLADASYWGEASGDLAGSSVSGLGDVNGDGFGDLAIGSCCSSVAGDEDGEGKLYLVFGRNAGWSADTSLAEADASFVGEATFDQLAGYHNSRDVAGVGDVNGDGLADIAVVAPSNDEAFADAGQVYLIFGKTSGWSTGVSISAVDASFHGESEDAYAGGVSEAGDVDGDGFDDFLVGAKVVDESDVIHPKAYLLLGKAIGWAMDSSLADADASFVSAVEGGVFTVAGAGDVFGDGLGDVLIADQFESYLGDDRLGIVYLLGPESEEEVLPDPEAEDCECSSSPTPAPSLLALALAPLATWLWKRRRSP